ncbi:unnamed protein product [Ceratitis capitata]|uniref:(Mediterranean fruit fly) hypothetical protein n=1 Tax=Ceratitis capitata TaxID=7213 RepID=A0A811U9B3_CERCA|nr:unnamed protein product [Ceratitis capitata]
MLAFDSTSEGNAYATESPVLHHQHFSAMQMKLHQLKQSKVTRFTKTHRKYPEITKLDGVTKPKKHVAKHHIQTTKGPPVTSKLREMSSEK